jgi:serine phosphatase RsbU (regulator of sigma subunit)
MATIGYHWFAVAFVQYLLIMPKESTIEVGKERLLLRKSCNGGNVLEIRAAVAKIGCTTAAESGDTLEIIERPGGGFSFVLVDGEGTGRGSKSLSDLLATRVLVLLKDGGSDTAVAQAIHDYLYTYRMGQVAATLNILSVDFANATMQMTRSNPAPFFVLTPHGLQTYNEPSTPIGLYASELPRTTVFPVEPFTYIVMFTDGLLHAGERFQEDIDLSNYLAAWPVTEGRDPEILTEDLLARVLEVDHGEPADDVSIISLAVLPTYQSSADDHLAYPARRLNLSFPFEDTHEKT